MCVDDVGLVLCITDSYRGNESAVAGAIASSDRSVCIKLNLEVNR